MSGMFEFQKRQRIRRLLHSRYAIAALIVLLLLMGRAVWGIHAKYEKSKDIALRSSDELNELKDRQAALEASIEALKTPEGEERELRNRFGVVKEGERMIILVDEKNAAAAATVVESKKWWQKLLEMLK